MDDFLAKPVVLTDSSMTIAALHARYRSTVVETEPWTAARRGRRRAGAPDLDWSAPNSWPKNGDRAIVAALLETFLAELDGWIDAIVGAVERADGERRVGGRRSSPVPSSWAPRGSAQLRDDRNR